MDNQQDQENPLMAKIREYVMKHNGLGGTDQKEKDIAENVDTSTDTPKNYADGGEVDIPQMLQAANSTPSTNYDFFKNISADDRAKLYQNLLAQQASPGNLATQGAAGLGDAIARSFGGQKTDYQQGLINRQQQNNQNIIGGMDTQRQQRMQDMTGNMEAMGNDPNSPLSQHMAATFQAAGIKVPPGVPANMLMKIAPSLGELAMKQATLGLQSQQVQNTMANQNSERVLDATKEKAHMGLLGQVKDKLFNNGQLTEALDQEIAEGNKSQMPSNHTVSGNGWTIKKVK